MICGRSIWFIDWSGECLVDHNDCQLCTKFKQALLEMWKSFSKSVLYKLNLDAWGPIWNKCFYEKSFLEYETKKLHETIRPNIPTVERLNKRWGIRDIEGMWIRRCHHIWKMKTSFKPWVLRWRVLNQILAMKNRLQTPSTHIWQMNAV